MTSVVSAKNEPDEAAKSLGWGRRFWHQEGGQHWVSSLGSAWHLLSPAATEGWVPQAGWALRERVMRGGKQTKQGPPQEASGRERAHADSLGNGPRIGLMVELNSDRAPWVGKGGYGTRQDGSQALGWGWGSRCFLLGAIGSLLPPGAGLRTKGLERGGWIGS